VASKCLEEVKAMRHVYAKGRYFDPLVHAVKATPEVSAAKIEVKATFISVPIFCSMPDQPKPKSEEDNYSIFRRLLQPLFEKMHLHVYQEKYVQQRHRQFLSEELRKRSDHPIRSLMEYANILALDSSRDEQQATLRLGDAQGPSPPIIKVPEMWALIINNCEYTLLHGLGCRLICRYDNYLCSLLCFSTAW
jgi:hypothetical protein